VRRGERRGEGEGRNFQDSFFLFYFPDIFLVSCDRGVPERFDFYRRWKRECDRRRIDQLGQNASSFVRFVSFSLFAKLTLTYPFPLLFLLLLLLFCSGVLRQIATMQEANYSFEVNSSIFDFFHFGIPDFKDKELHQLSVTNEPTESM
jgi:hypothetical protein